MATVETKGGVSFALTDEQRELRALARSFAEKEIRPRAAECDEHQTHAALGTLHLPYGRRGKSHANGFVLLGARNSHSLRRVFPARENGAFR